MAVARFAIIRGEAVPVDDLAEALRIVEESGGLIITCRDGKLVVLRVEELSQHHVAAGGAPQEAPRRAGRVAVVFDQMFKGMGEIVARELEGVDPYEVLGRGISGPVRRGRVTLLPAEDDYDVMKNVLDLAGRYDLVVFYTGDKRLARQVQAAGRGNVEVKYTPPGEYPGKEALARAVVEYLGKKVAGASQEV